jgi:hypothetical protein
MAMPRRNLIRPVQSPPARPHSERQLQKLRARLEAERSALSRWMSRLRRSFHAVETSQRCLSRIERRISQLEE